MLHKIGLFIQKLLVLHTHNTIKQFMKIIISRDKFAKMFNVGNIVFVKSKTNIYEKLRFLLLAVHLILHLYLSGNPHDLWLSR